MASKGSDATENDRKPMFAFRAEEPLARQIEVHAQENDMSKSDAIRDLVRQGLEAEELHEEISQLQEQIEHLQQLEVRIEDLEAERQQTSGLLGRLF